MTGMAHNDGHLDAGELLRHLDGALLRFEQARVVAHLESCEVCRQAGSALAIEAGDAGAALSRLDTPPVPPARRSAALEAVRAAAAARPVPAIGGRQRSFAHRLVTFPRVAAAAAILLVALGSASPVRAWVAEQLQRLSGSRAAVEAPAVEAPRAFSVLHFAPGETVRLEFGALAEGGELELHFRDVPVVSVDIPQEARIMTLPDMAGVRIENTTEDVPGIYSATIPTSVDRLTIVVRGGTPVGVGRGVAGSTLTFTLTPDGVVKLREQ